MTALRANFGDLLAPGFMDVYHEEFDRYPDEYTQIFNLKNSARQYEDLTGVSGFGLVPDKNEGEPTTYDDPIQGFNRRLTHTTRSLGFRVTEEMWEDDLYDVMVEMPRALGYSMKQTIETDAANILNRAFNSSYTGGDGVELCSTAHPLTGGGTEQNELTTAADLSETTLEQAFIDISETTDDRGLKIRLMPRKLIVPQNGFYQASKLINSTLVPESANNAVNPSKGSLQIIVNHYLTDTDAWFVQCDLHKLLFIYRVKPGFKRGNDFDTDDAKFKTRSRWVAGWGEWRGFYGSPG